MTNLPRLLLNLTFSLRRLHWNRCELKRFQEKRLRNIIRNAYEAVPFYREIFKKAGITPDDIATLEDLAKVPVVEKGTLRHENPSNLISKDYEKERLKAVRTSGSTGEPFQVLISKPEDDWRKSIYMRANISCGQRARDRWAVITAPHHFSDTTSLQRFLGIFSQSCISVFTPMDEQIRLVQNIRPQILDGYSGSILLFAKEVERKGVENINPRIVFGTAELIDSVSCRVIEKVLNAPYYDQFGCSEVDRTAWQCPEKAGYHMDVDSVITEFLDEKKQNVADGERGEIVYTSLFNYAMPIIRYAVGDVGTPTNEECPCGRTLPLMDVVEGRKDSLLILPGGGYISPRTFTVAMSMFEGYNQIEQFQVVQKRVDTFKIYLKEKSGFHDQALGDKLIKHVKNVRKPEFDNVNFDIEYVDEIPKGKSGKHRSVVSEMT